MAPLELEFTPLVCIQHSPPNLSLHLWRGQNINTPRIKDSRIIKFLERKCIINVCCYDRRGPHIVLASGPPAILWMVCKHEMGFGSFDPFIAPSLIPPPWILIVHIINSMQCSVPLTASRGRQTLCYGCESHFALPFVWYIIFILWYNLHIYRFVHDIVWILNRRH